MRLVNGFSDGLSYGFLHWVGETTTLTIERNENPKMREEGQKRSRETNIFLFSW